MYAERRASHNVCTLSRKFNACIRDLFHEMSNRKHLRLTNIYVTRNNNASQSRYSNAFEGAMYVTFVHSRSDIPGKREDFGAVPCERVALYEYNSNS